MVRVSDLCERCGVERRVFYYHFKDKYDLVAWMFEQDYQAARERGAPSTQELYAEANETALRRFLGVRALSQEAAFEARHVAYGNIGCAVDWLRGTIEATPAQLAARMFACMPPLLRNAYERAAGTKTTP